MRLLGRLNPWGAWSQPAKDERNVLLFMSTTILLGLLLVTLAGALEGLFSLGVTRTPKWAWENSWGLGSLIALVLVPWPLALLTVPSLGEIYGSVPGMKLMLTFLFGIGWGLGGIFWGKAIAAVGMALGVSLLMGLINIFGSLTPFVIFQGNKLGTSGGMALIGAIVLMVVGVVCMARAGSIKERDMNSAPAGSGKSSTPFAVGLLFCVLSGALSSLVNFSFIFGDDIAKQASRSGAPGWATGFAIWALVFTGNYLVNFSYALALLIKNRTFGRFREGGISHWFWALFMGLAWPGGIAIYGIAAYLLGEYGAYVGFPMMLVISILFGNLAGALSGEWKAASRNAISWMVGGVAVLVCALVAMGWSNNLLAN